MNILIVSLFPLERNTSVANSSISIINGLLELGHQVTVVMPQWPNNETAVDLGKMQVVRIPGKPDMPPSRKLAKKLHSHFYFLDLTRGYLKHIGDVNLPKEYFDIVLSFSDPKTSHVYTARLLHRKRIQYGRWIQHWGDPIVGDITRNFWWPKWVIKWYERRLIKKADKAVYVTPFTQNMLQDAYPDLRSRLSFVPLPAEMLPIEPIDSSDVLRLSYLGDYNPVFRNLRPLYDACANKPNIQLTMAGNGPKYPSCSNVTIFSRIPQQQARQIENDSDVLVCVCNRVGTQIPGKIMYKASTNKHILVALEDDNYEAMKTYFESYNRYVLCRNTAESIAAALEELKTKKADYKTPSQLLPVNIAQQIIE